MPVSPVPCGSAPPQHEARGAGSLRCAVVAGVSAIVERRAREPLNLLVPRRRGTVAWAYAGSYGGGLLAGDHLALDVTVERGASLMLGTQASTKIYRSENGAVATQTLTAQVAADGLLALLPDPIACFAGARYRQHQRIDLDAGASLALLDACTGGRSARAEHWACASYASRLEIRRDDVPVLIDGLRLEPGRRALADRLAGCEAIATVVLLGDAVGGTARQIFAAVAARPARSDDGVLMAASPIADGCLLRLGAATVSALTSSLRLLFLPLLPLLGDDPWARRP